MNEQRSDDDLARTPEGDPAPALRATPQLIAGGILLALGLALLLERLDLVRPFEVGRLWPLVVIAFGLSRIFGQEEPRELRRGWLLFLFGVWFFINTFEFLGLDWGTSWPLTLVAVGSARLLAGETGRRRGSALFLIGLGALFQVLVLDLFGIGLTDGWPLILIAAGVWITLRAFGVGARPATRKENEHEPS